MDINSVRDEIKLKLTGEILELELEDSTINNVINVSLREIQRYISTTRLKTIPYTPCINMSAYDNVNSVSRVFRAHGYSITDSAISNGQFIDPMYLGLWQSMSGNGNLFNTQEWALNYASWNTALQMRNTISTDLTFRYDRETSNLYVNCGFDKPDLITVEYVPRYNDVSEIKSDFWIDMLIQLACALTKQIVGRVRSRYTQSNSLWSQDGETLLNEANEELNALREQMKANSQLVYPID